MSDGMQCLSCTGRAIDRHFTVRVRAL